MNVKSNLAAIEYNSTESVRIVNQKQQLFYLSNEVYPIDIYTSYDGKNDRKIIVMIFRKNETKELYQKWCNYDVEI
jgi:hypothetical protein